MIAWRIAFIVCESPASASKQLIFIHVSQSHICNTDHNTGYMGLPSNNCEGYRDGSPITHARHLKGNLLLIHGTGDDNCHYAGTEALIDELIRHNKQFQMLSYPNRSHSISEGRNTSLHLFGALQTFLMSKVPADAR